MTEEKKKYHTAWRKRNPEKWAAYAHKWYLGNKEKKKQTMKIWEIKNADKIAVRRKKWRDANKEHRATSQRELLLGYKRLVVAAYGGACSCCGENEIAFLTVEHLDKNGKEHRKVRGNFYGYLVKNKFPKDNLTILCMNCNWAERNKFKCPHKRVLLEMLA